MKGGILRRELRTPRRLLTRGLIASALATGILAFQLAVAHAGVETAPISTGRLKTVPVPANDVAYDSTLDVVLATIQNKNPSLGNKLVELDPETGTIGLHVYVGSDPGPVALADDGTTAYVGLRGASRIAKVDLATFKLVDTFSTGADPGSGPLFAEDLEVVPGRNDVVVASLQNVGFSPRHEGVWVFEEGVPLLNQTRGPPAPSRLERGLAGSSHRSSWSSPMEGWSRPRLLITGLPRRPTSCTPNT